MVAISHHRCARPHRTPHSGRRGADGAVRHHGSHRGGDVSTVCCRKRSRIRVAVLPDLAIWLGRDHTATEHACSAPSHEQSARAALRRIYAPSLWELQGRSMRRRHGSTQSLRIMSGKSPGRAARISTAGGQAGRGGASRTMQPDGLDARASSGASTPSKMSRCCWKPPSVRTRASACGRGASLRPKTRSRAHPPFAVPQTPEIGRGCADCGTACAHMRASCGMGCGA